MSHSIRHISSCVIYPPKAKGGLKVTVKVMLKFLENYVSEHLF